MIIGYLIKVSETLKRIVHLVMILNRGLKSFLKRNYTDKHGWFLEFARVPSMYYVITKRGSENVNF